MKKRRHLLVPLSIAFALPSAMILILLIAGTGCMVSSVRTKGPCDIYTAGGYPCVTAHSTTRALYASYNGPLYQVIRESDGRTLDIGVVASGKGDRGTGISFTPAMRFEHKSGDAVQALGSGLTLNEALEKDHEAGTPVINTARRNAGFYESVKPDQWFGAPLSASAGSLALMDAGDDLVVDAVVYGSQFTNSSANGTITSPGIATLEGVQTQAGCIAVVPAAPRGFPPAAPVMSQPDRSLGRFPDGADTDSNCDDFMLQTTTTLAAPPAKGSKNIKVYSVSGFSSGDEIIIGQGANSEKAVIAETGTAGATITAYAVSARSTAIPVSGMEGFTSGQTVTIGSGTNTESAVISSIVPVRRRFGDAGNTVPRDTLKFTAPLNFVHDAGVQVSGSGITFTSPLSKIHERGEQVAGSIPTPGKPNQYYRK